MKFYTCACGDHFAIPKGKDQIAVVAPRTTERHGLNHCIRVKHVKHHPAFASPNEVRFTRLDNAKRMAA